MPTPNDTEQKIPPELWLDEPMRSKIAERVWNAAIERCAEIASQFEFIYEGRKVDGYSKGAYAMISGPKSVEAIVAEIRKLAIAPQKAESK